MNQKLNTIIRSIGIVAAIAAGVFAYLLKGKMEAAMTATKFAVEDTEIAAAKEFDPRMKEISAKTTALLNKKRERILELEGNKKDLEADVADKKTKIEGLTANVASLEGERAELTRKRDELTSQLADTNSKKDAALAELSASKEELVKEKEKSASMFTKEQLDEQAAKAKMAEESLDTVKTRYAALYNYAAARSETKVPLPRDPLAVDASKDTASAAAAVPTDTILTKVLSLDAKTGIIAFSVGEQNNIKNGNLYDVLVNGTSIGKVRFYSVKAALSFAQVAPDDRNDLNAFAAGKIVTLAPL